MKIFERVSLGIWTFLRLSPVVLTLVTIPSYVGQISFYSALPVCGKKAFLSYLYNPVVPVVTIIGDTEMGPPPRIPNVKPLGLWVLDDERVERTLLPWVPEDGPGGDAAGGDVEHLKVARGLKKYQTIERIMHKKYLKKNQNVSQNG